MKYILQGLTMGIAYVAPIGMQNLFVINSALTNRLRRAMLTALIVIFFDITLSLACFFGIGAMMQHYTWLQMAILFIGSLIVICIGIGLVRSEPTELGENASDMTILRTVTSACVVTWFNPQAIIDGTMMLGAFSVTLPRAGSYLFLIGVMSASCIWFTALTLLISMFSKHFTKYVMQKINIVCGLIIIFYGCKLMYSFISAVIG